MQCYVEKTFYNIQFDKVGYQQFLREQGLSEHDIKWLNIHLITNFTCRHFKGSTDLDEGGTFFQRCKEYVEQENRNTLAFYRPYNPPFRYTAIFLRHPKYSPLGRLNHTFLHETRHHIQHCLKLPCCSRVNVGLTNEAFTSRNQPWETDAEQFAIANANQVSFFTYRPLRRSDLQWMR